MDTAVEELVDVLEIQGIYENVKKVDRMVSRFVPFSLVIMSDFNFCWACIGSLFTVVLPYSTITMVVVDVVNVVVIDVIYSINCSLWAFQFVQLRCLEAGDQRGDCTCLLFAARNRVF